MKNNWKGIRQIINLNPKSFHAPIKIIKHNIELVDGKSIADAFNDFFANIGSKLANSISPASKSPLSSLPPQKPNSFYLLPVTSNEIEQVISILDIRKACGPFSIPTKLLKLLKCFLSKPLETIFNVSFTTGMVPDDFKIAKGIPIYKKGLNTSLGNYRPISLLSIFNLILEKLIFKRLMNFIETQNILYSKQFGFRQKYSTTQALLSITIKIQKAVDEGTYSCGIFLDFSKAFDTVDHNILIMKLDHLMASEGLLKSGFLPTLTNENNMCQLAMLCQTTNKSCGVPQGSVLGPLLFLLYINDFNNSSNQLDFHLFADDSNLFYAHKSLLQLETTVNNELHEVFNWLCASKLSHNIEKSNYVIFRPPQKLVNYPINLKINSQILMHENSIKYLGIMIDSHLNWKSQVSYISKKIKRNIGILSKIRHFVNLKTLSMLYYSLHISIFDIWNFCMGEHLQIYFSPNYNFTKTRFVNHYFF